MFGFLGSKESLSEEEKKECVVELRKRLEDGSQPVEEQLRAGGEAGLAQGPGLDDAFLHRWLRAEDHSIDAAEKRIRPHAIWRQKNFPHGRVNEDEIAQELAAQKVFLQGCDKMGRQVTVLLVERHKRSKRDLAENMRFLCYCLDAAIAQADKEKNPLGKITGVFDLRDINMDCIDQQALRGVFDMLQNHYPERLGKLFMYESPGIFWALWKVVSPFIDPVTRKKVAFVSGHSAISDMEAEISLDVLPKGLGGKAELVPIEVAVQRVRNQVPAAQNGHAQAL